MTEAIKTPYKMDLLKANKTKLYNQGAFWAFNTAKYRALLSNDPTVIKYWYKTEAGMFYPDVFKMAELQRSFYFSDEFVENAEEFFGIIPMICENIAKMVAGSGYVFSETTPEEYVDRLTTILEDNSFDTGVLKKSLIETLGLGDAAWHIHFDPEISSYPLIELVPPERLEVEKKCNRIVKFIIKQQVFVDGKELQYELHTVYTKRRKKVDVNGAIRYVDDGILMQHMIWNGSRYLTRDTTLKAKIFNAYGVEEEIVLPLADFPVVYLPNNLNSAENSVINENARPHGIVFGLESVSSAIDEILSNCVDTVRKAFPFLMIDDQMIPSTVKGDKDKGAFSTRRHSFITPKNVTDPEKMLQMMQAQLNTTEYVDSVKLQINIALNKVGINAATLGLQLSGHVEAEATQNAKERNSIRTRNSIAGDYEQYLENLFAVLLQYDDFIQGNAIVKDKKTGEEAFMIEEYHGIKATFNKYIIDTPEEVSKVLAEKVNSNLMSIYTSVKEQYPEWDNETIVKEANMIIADKFGVQYQVKEPKKPKKE